MTPFPDTTTCKRDATEFELDLTSCMQQFGSSNRHFAALLSVLNKHSDKLGGLRVPRSVATIVRMTSRAAVPIGVDRSAFGKLQSKVGSKRFKDVEVNVRAAMRVSMVDAFLVRDTRDRR